MDLRKLGNFLKFFLCRALVWAIMFANRFLFPLILQLLNTIHTNILHIAININDD